MEFLAEREMRKNYQSAIRQLKPGEDMVPQIILDSSGPFQSGASRRE